jgi:hypothetical protein
MRSSSARYLLTQRLAGWPIRLLMTSSSNGSMASAWHHHPFPRTVDLGGRCPRAARSPLTVTSPAPSVDQDLLIGSHSDGASGVGPASGEGNADDGVSRVVARLNGSFVCHLASASVDVTRPTPRCSQVPQAAGWRTPSGINGGPNPGLRAARARKCRTPADPTIRSAVAMVG